MIQVEIGANRCPSHTLPRRVIVLYNKWDPHVVCPLTQFNVDLIRRVREGSFIAKNVLFSGGGAYMFSGCDHILFFDHLTVISFTNFWIILNFYAKIAACKIFQQDIKFWGLATSAKHVGKLMILITFNAPSHKTILTKFKANIKN